MARPPQDAIETFKAITGAPEDVAVFKLEEHRGDLNAAINAHFSEADRVNMQDQALSTAREDFMDIDDEAAIDPEVQHYPLFPASRAVNPFSPLDPVVPPHSFVTRSSRNIGAPRISHPRDVREIPIEVKDGSGQSSQLIPTVQDVTESLTEHGSTVQGNIFIDDEEDAVSLVPPPARNLRTNDDYPFRPAPSAPLINEVIDIDDDVEEQMIRAAIEASKQEASTSQGNKFKPADTIPLLERTGDVRAIYDTAVDSGQSKTSSLSGTRIAQTDHLHEANGRSKSEEVYDAEDSEGQPLMRRRSSRRHDLVTGNGLLVDGSHSEQHGDNQPQLNGDIFSDEWGGLSSEERHEAMMLEAMFGGVPESSAYPSAQPLQSLSGRQAAFHARVSRSPSPNLVAQRILREQQDDEYLASLAADREKEVKAIQEAELRRSEEESAQKAALEQERHKKEAAERKLREEEEYEIQLSVKLASLPQEPAADDENAVTLLVRLPDGSRQGRRFLKSDTLGALFDFMDVGKLVKPSTYRLVRPYPRCSFGEADKERSLSELGLTSKQEALFLEFI